LDVPVKPRVILGKNVYSLRQRQKMTQEELSEYAEIDRRYVQRIEAGTANLGIDVMERVRRALKCRWDELLRGI